MEWQPDRTKEALNPVALMQFSDESTALLLRTHRTLQYLPEAVRHCLESETCLKVGVGWDGPDKTKFANTFRFQPYGIHDLAQTAKQKGLKESGLKSLTEHFGWRMCKDGRMARSNWAQSEELSEDQIMYAAEDAYFSYLLYDKLNALPDPGPEDFAALDSGVLALQPGWGEQGIERRHDGLYCSLCDKGPMTVPMVVGRHLESTKHIKKVEGKKGIGLAPGQLHNIPALPEEYRSQHIISGADENGGSLKLGEFKCTLCDAGPFNAFATIDAHLKSKKHMRHMQPAPLEPAPIQEVFEQKDSFAERLWNMPNYVEVLEGGKMLDCTLCSSKAPAILAMCKHLGGNFHAKKCRQHGYPEVLWIEARNRVEEMASGKAVVREGFRKPKNCDEEDAQAARANAETKAKVKKVRDVFPLPQGWQEHKDPASAQYYYYHHATKTSTWIRPDPDPDPSAPACPTSLPSAEEAVEAQAATQATCDAQAESQHAPNQAQAEIQTQADVHAQPAEKVQSADQSQVQAQGPSNQTPVQIQNIVHAAAGEERKRSTWAQKKAAQAAEAAAASTAKDEEHARLPPGWVAVWSTDYGEYYYCDAAAHLAQWEQPVPHVQDPWKRLVDGHERAYWTCETADGILSFYEDDASWERLVDPQNRTFWGHSASGRRFWDQEVYV